MWRQQEIQPTGPARRQDKAAEPVARESPVVSQPPGPPGPAHREVQNTFVRQHSTNADEKEANKKAKLSSSSSEEEEEDMEDSDDDNDESLSPSGRKEQ